VGTLCLQYRAQNKLLSIQSALSRTTFVKVLAPAQTNRINNTIPHNQQSYPEQIFPGSIDLRLVDSDMQHSEEVFDSATKYFQNVTRQQDRATHVSNGRPRQQEFSGAHSGALSALKTCRIAAIRPHSSSSSSSSAFPPASGHGVRTSTATLPTCFPRSTEGMRCSTRCRYVHSNLVSVSMYHAAILLGVSRLTASQVFSIRGVFYHWQQTCCRGDVWRPRSSQRSNTNATFKMRRLPNLRYGFSTCTQQYASDTDAYYLGHF